VCECHTCLRNVWIYSLGRVCLVRVSAVAGWACGWPGAGPAPPQ
jgi:hypothetical protein